MEESTPIRHSFPRTKRGSVLGEPVVFEGRNSKIKCYVLGTANEAG